MKVLRFQFLGINSPKWITVLPLNGELWFPPAEFFWMLNIYERGEDLGRSKFLASLEDYQKKVFIPPITIFRAFPTTCINESGLYTLLITAAHRERGKMLQRWVYQVLIPRIRYNKFTEGLVMKEEELAYSLVG